MAVEPRPLWQRLHLPDPLHSKLAADDICIFARDYVSGAGYGPPGNDRVQNFKKSTSTRGTKEWQHKLRAIAQFAEELAELFRPEVISRDVVCTFVPPSTTVGLEDHDPRFEMLAEQLRARRPSLLIRPLLERTCCVKPLHAGGPRSVDAQMASMRIARSSGALPPTVVVIDDVLTSGCTFKACKRILAGAGVQTVVGVFWTRTVKLT